MAPCKLENVKARVFTSCRISGHKYLARISLSNLFCMSLSSINILTIKWVMERQNHDDHLNFNKYYPLKFSFLELAFHVNSYKGNFFFKSNYGGCTLQVTVNYRINILLSRWSSYTKPHSYFITLVKVTFLWCPKEWKRLGLFYKIESSWNCMCL